MNIIHADNQEHVVREIIELVEAIGLKHGAVAARLQLHVSSWSRIVQGRKPCPRTVRKMIALRDQLKASGLASA